MDEHTEKRKSFSDRLRYADDFRIETETDSKTGRIRKKAVYIGNWFIIRNYQSADSWKMVAALIASILIMICQFLLLLQIHVGSGSLFVMLPMAAGLFPGLYMVMGAVALPYKGKPMRRDQYMHSIIRMSRSAVAILSCNLVGFIATLVHRIIIRDWLFLQGDLFYSLLLLCSVALSVGIIILLRGLDVVEKPNSAFQTE